MEGQSGQTTMEELFGPPISVYTREQAFEDGQLIDVSTVAREAGIRHPCAVTRGVWAWIDPRPMPACQDMAGRLWDVVWMTRFAMRSASGDRCRPSVSFAGGPGLGGRRRARVDMIAVCGPADDGSPCITIMLPEED